MQVITEPGGAEVFVNGENRGRSPDEGGKALEIRLAGGEYVIDAYKRADDHFEWKGRVEHRHVADAPSAPVVVRLVQGLTPAGEAFVAEQRRALDAREQALVARFELDGRGTAIDTETGLMWMRCSVGQEWTGSTCSGEAAKLSWNGALEAAAKASLAGYDDWRMPTREELYTLVYCSSGRRFALDAEGQGGACDGNFDKPVILKAVFPATPLSNYWSATDNERYSYKAWGVAFSSGFSGTGSKTEYVAARLVRKAD